MFQKKKKSVVFLNNRNIVGFLERRCGQGTMNENEVTREAMIRKWTTVLIKLEKAFPSLFFVCVLLSVIL